MDEAGWFGSSIVREVAERFRCLVLRLDVGTYSCCCGLGARVAGCLVIPHSQQTPRKVMEFGMQLHIIGPRLLSLYPSPTNAIKQQSTHASEIEPAQSASLFGDQATHSTGKLETTRDSRLGTRFLICRHASPRRLGVVIVSY